MALRIVVDNAVRLLIPVWDGLKNRVVTKEFASEEAARAWARKANLVNYSIEGR